MKAQLEEGERLEGPEGELLGLTQAEHFLIGAGFRLEDIREGMTLRDFKAFLYLTLKTKLEMGQAQSAGLGLAISSVISEESGKIAADLNAKVSEQVKSLGAEFEGLYSKSELPKKPQDVGTVEVPKVAPPVAKTEEEIAFEKHEKVWTLLQKFDAGFAKLTGAPTNAPWASYNRANLHTTKFEEMQQQIDAGKGGLREVMRSRGIDV